MRRLSDQSGGIPIAVRHIESIIRISEAHAKVSVAVRFETAFCVVSEIENSVWCDPSAQAHLRNMVTDEVQPHSPALASTFYN